MKELPAVGEEIDAPAPAAPVARGGAALPAIGEEVDAVVPPPPDPAAQRAKDVALVEFRSRHFPVEPARAAEALRIAGATGMDPTYALEHLDQLGSTLKPFLESQVDWDEVARKHPGVFGAVLDPVRGPVIKAAVGELQGVEWAITGKWETLPRAPGAAGGDWASLLGPTWARRYEEATGQPAASARARFQAPQLRQVVPSAPQAALEKGTAQQEAVRLGYQAFRGEAPADYAARRTDLRELAEADIGVDGGTKGFLERGFLAPFEMAPYLAGRVAASAAARTAAGAAGAVIGGAAGLATTGVGVVPGALVGWTVAQNTVGHAADYAAGVAWDTYQNVGPLFEQLRDLKDQDGKPLLTDEQARTYALAGAASIGTVTAGLGGKLVESIPGVKALLGREAGGALARTVAQRTVPAAVAELVKTGGKHLAAGALLMAAQEAGTTATLELAAANNSAHEFDWGRVGTAFEHGLETGIRDMWLLSFWAPGKQFLGDVGAAAESSRGAARIERFVDAFGEAQKKVPAEGQSVLDQVVSHLAQSKDPDTLRTLFFRKATWDERAAKLGVDPAQLAAEVLGDGGKAYGEASLTGGDIVVPIAMARKLLRGSKDAADFVKQDARTAPELRSAREVLADQVAQAEKMTAAAATPEHVREKQAIFEAIRGRALAAKEPGQRATDLARQFSEAAGAIAARLGVPVAEAASMMGIGRLRIAGGAAAKLGKLRQDRIVGDALPELFGMLAEKSQERVRRAVTAVPKEDAAGRAEVLGLSRDAYFDPRTNLPNVLAFDDMKKSATPDHAFIAADMSGLKAVNDTLGHEAGNEAMAVFTRAFRKAVEEHGGKIARTGGDEFQAVVRREVARAAVDRTIAILKAEPAFRTSEALAALEPALRAQAEAWWPEGGEFKVSGRFGIGPTPEIADKAELVAREKQLERWGDVRKGGKTTQGHGESFLEDAFDPSSPKYAEAQAASIERLARWQKENPGRAALTEVEPGAVVSVKKTTLEQGRRGEEHGSLEFELDDGTGKPLEATLYLSDPNALTGSHEFVHFLVEALSRMAARGELAREKGGDGVPTLLEDYASLLRWAGYDSNESRLTDARRRVELAGEKKRTAEQDRELKALTAKEERIARAWEQFLGEGRAPSAGLAGAFRRFSRWVGRIYGGIEGIERSFDAQFGEEIGLTDDVRDVFRRLVASQDEIAKAKQAEEHLPFTAALERHGTPEERARWAELDAQDQVQAEGALIEALTLETRREQRAVVNELRGKVRAQVEAELDQNPTYRALRYLTEGTLVAGEPPPPDLVGAEGKPLQLDRAALVKAYGADLVKQLPQDAIAEKGGATADDLAAGLGFPSGDALVRALVAAEPRDTLVKRATAKRVLEQLGPTLLEDPVRLKEAALDASYTEASAKKVNLAMRVLAREVDPSLHPRLPELDLELARTQAERIIGEKPVGELSPEYYRQAAQAAARRAFAAAAEAAEGKDPAKRQAKLVEAFDAYQAQALSQALYREAKRVRERMDSIRAQLEKTGGDAWRAELGLASPAYRDVHDELLAAIGVGKPLDPAEARASFDQMLQVAAGDAAVMDESWQATVRSLLRYPRDWGELTPDEVEAVHDAVRNIRRAANLKNEITLLDKTITKDHLLEQMDAAARAANPTRKRGARDAALEGDQVTLAKGVRGLAASLLGIETIARYLDGPENRDGPFHRVFVDGLIAARNKEAELAKSYGKVLLDAWEAMPKEVKDRRFELVDLRRELPLADELRQSAWVDDGAVSRTYLWMIFLNRGNRQNLQRLLDGYGWTLDQVDAALEKHLTPAEGRFLQRILDSLEGLYPEIAKLHERDTGLKPGKVPAEAFSLELGGERIEFAGGYFPAKYDPRPGMSKRGYAAQEREIASILNPESLYPGTPKSHTKARAVAVNDVINLDWGVVPAHVSQVIHDLAFREYVRQTAAVVVDPRLRTTIASTIGVEYYDQLKPWLQTVATGREVAVTSEIRPAFNLVMLGRSRAMVAALGHRLSTALGDLANPLIAGLSGRVRPDYLAMATAKLTPGAPGWRETWAMVNSVPELAFRRDRATSQLREEFRAIGEGSALLRNAKTREVGELVKRAQETAFAAMETTDRLTSAGIWLGAYLQEKARVEREGRPDADARARRAASDMVRELQPAEWAGEKAAILRRRDVFGSILMFYGWLNKIHQLKREAVHEAVVKWRDPNATVLQALGQSARAAGELLGITIAVSLGDLASGNGKLQDDEDWGAWWRRKLTAGQFIDLPAVGPWVEWGYSKYVEGKAARFPVRTAPGLAFGENLVRELGKLGADDAEVDDRLWAALRAAGLVTGLPVTQVATTGHYVTSGGLVDDLDAGRPLDVVGGALYGERPKQPENPATALQKLIDGR